MPITCTAFSKCDVRASSVTLFIHVVPKYCHHADVSIDPSDLFRYQVPCLVEDRSGVIYVQTLSSNAFRHATLWACTLYHSNPIQVWIFAAVAPHLIQKLTIKALELVDNRL